MLYTLVHGLEGIVNIVSQELGVNVDQWVIHPCLMPLQPVSCRDPQVLERLKLTSQLPDLVILHTERQQYLSRCWLVLVVYTQSKNKPRALNLGSYYWCRINLLAQIEHLQGSTLLYPQASHSFKAFPVKQQRARCGLEMRLGVSISPCGFHFVLCIILYCNI